MASEFEAKIINDFAYDTASKSNEAAIIAREAGALGAQDLSKRAFQTLLDIEPLIHDPSTLLNATSVVRRRDKDAATD